MKDAILNTFAFNLNYAQMLTKDLTVEQACVQPQPGMNHATWVIGHLANTLDNAAELLGLPRQMPEAWKTQFGGGSKPTSDASMYPPLAEALSALESQHTRITEAFRNVGEAVLRSEAPERFRKRFATNADLLAFVLTSHEMLHLGQVSAWRRAQGLPSALGR